MKKEGLEYHTIGEKHNLGWNPSGEGEGSEGRVFGGREKKFLLREKWESEIWFRAEPI